MSGSAQDWDSLAVSLRHDFHAHPELGFQEVRTAGIVAERLEAAGLVVSSGIATTGVVGVLHGDLPGKTIAWRADMDALPLQEEVDLPFRSKTDGVMHACGHDGHTAVALALAEALAANRRQLHGNIVFIFQPAEEIFQGARAMLKTGLLENFEIDEVYGLHFTSNMPCGRIGVRPGPMWASADGFEIQIQGAGGHGAFPHLTVNPIMAASQIAIGLPALVALESSAQETLVLSIGEFHAGTAYNIIPETAQMSGSLRTLDDAARDQIMLRILEYSQMVAKAHGAEARLTWSPHTCPCLINHAHAAELVHQCAVESEGESMVDHVKPSLASDDMSLFLRERPGCYFKIGAALEGPERPHHSPQFAIDDRALAVALRVGDQVVRRAAQRVN